MYYKLKIFQTVALTKSFTQAAQRLNLSQPAISKNIKKLEEEYRQTLFDRKNNSIELTSSGVALLKYADEILRLYQQARENIAEGDLIFPNSIYIGASTTIANYILPQSLAILQQKHPEITFELQVGNTHKIQEALLSKQLNIGIVEGQNHNSRLSYKKFIKDELVLVAGHQNRNIPSSIKAKNLLDYQIVEREYGSGTREVIQKAFDQSPFSLPDSHAVLGSTESIKSFLYHTNSVAFLSVHAVGKELIEKKLKLIEVEDITLTRYFYFVTRQGYYSKVSDQIFHLLKSTYNQ